MWRGYANQRVINSTWCLWGERWKWQELPLRPCQSGLDSGDNRWSGWSCNSHSNLSHSSTRRPLSRSRMRCFQWCVQVQDEVLKKKKAKLKKAKIIMTQHFLLFQIQYIFSEIAPCALTWKYSNNIQILLHVAPRLTGFLCRNTHQHENIYFTSYANWIMNKYLPRITQ